jgi:glycerol uptake facilitator-like aquaporin
MPSLAQRLFAEALGTAFLLAAVVGSGIMAAKLAGGNGAIATRFRPARFWSYSS